MSGLFELLCLFRKDIRYFVSPVKILHHSSFKKNTLKLDTVTTYDSFLAERGGGIRGEVERTAAETWHKEVRIHR